MNLDLAHLNDPDVRKAMTDELQADIDGERLFISPRVSPLRLKEYGAALRIAVEEGNDEAFAAKLAAGMLRTRETIRRKGLPVERPMPKDAPRALAEEEVHRFYLRGLAVHALATDNKDLEIYRAKIKPVSKSKAKALEATPPAALAKTQIPARRLLDDLRFNTPAQVALGATPEADGLSARIPVSVEVTGETPTESAVESIVMAEVVEVDAVEETPAEAEDVS